MIKKEIMSEPMENPKNPERIMSRREFLRKFAKKAGAAALLVTSGTFGVLEAACSLIEEQRPDEIVILNGEIEIDPAVNIRRSPVIENNFNNISFPQGKHPTVSVRNPVIVMGTPYIYQSREQKEPWYQFKLNNETLFVAALVEGVKIKGKTGEERLRRQGGEYVDSAGQVVKVGVAVEVAGEKK